MIHRRQRSARPGGSPHQHGLDAGGMNSTKVTVVGTATWRNLRELVVWIGQSEEQRDLNFATGRYDLKTRAEAVVARSFPVERYEPSNAELWNRHYSRFREYLELACA